ncbi:uncharacterized protein [Chelonus insularis]|uniref:uncharacterized protein n=1 Tax=Chelonus insularis TaxID=460826 RepID=UPI00158A0CDE|nr:uncharacterized protein LOC118074740 [Chelonus insularis]
MSGWVVTLAVVLAIAVIAGATLALYRRYCINVKWGARNIWSICEEWRQRLSWLWAPREEKVGLVKAQHPTAHCQTIPGLYRHSSNNSQHLLHSDSDLRLDAQGAFTRFESVDRDLHPPLGVSGNTIPPQPLRPAPQPRPTARPRPSPLQTPYGAEYLRQETGPGPLTPPPVPRPSVPHRGGAQPVFVFQNELPQSYSHSQYVKACNGQSALHFDPYTSKSIPESIQTSAFATNNPSEVKVSGFEPRYESLESFEEKMKDAYLSRINREIPYRSYDLIDDSSKLKYGISQAQMNERSVMRNSDDIRSVSSYPEYNKPASKNQHQMRHVRNDSRGSYSSFNFINSNNSNSQNIMESIYGPQAVTKLLQNSQIYNNDLGTKDDGTQSIEMTPFRNTAVFPEDLSYEIHANSKIQGLQRVSQYIQSLPDVPIYDSMSDQAHEDQIEDDGTLTPNDNELAPSPVPPPAPPDPSNSVDMNRKNGLTTGERIFSALRSVTSQSYIDASEFYNSVLSSAQQVPMLTFPTIRRSSLQLEKDSPANSIQDEASNLYIDVEPEAIGIDGSRRASDLYSPELNLKAHQTAQEVYNSLQDPPSSPLLLKDLSQEPYPYMSDPSFTRTSEDIFNSIEQRRKSMERLNGLHEYVEMESINNVRRRSSQDLYNALEEVQLKRRLSQQVLDESYGYSNFDMEEITPGSRQNSQGPEPEPPPDETNLKRAVSCESVCSDTSVVLDDLEEITVGHVCVGLEYERWAGRGTDIKGDLAVSVLEARDLIARDGRPAQDTLARVCLLPDRQTHVQTRLYRGSPAPSYQEKFSFPLDGGPVGRTLLVEIFSVDLNMGGEAYLLGEATLKLGPVARTPATTWLPLISPTLSVPHLGEIMFSLSYSPTAERLTLVVVKARNLRGANEAPGEFFVKVYLLQQGKKMHKKKTSVKRGEKSPTFNEAMIFNVPVHTLQTIQLRLTVAEWNSDSGANSKAYSVGHVITGSNATGKSSTHWRQMLSAPRRPVAMWHPLRK